MSLELHTKKRKKGKDYLFVDKLSFPTYENSIFRITFNYDTLKKEQIEEIDKFLQNISEDLIQILDGYDTISEHSGSHEDRIRALENEIATLTNTINSQKPEFGVLKITPIPELMDFTQEGTKLKFMNENGVYTTATLQNNVETQIILPVGEYKVDVVNSLNNMVDCVFTELWETGTSDDNNHTMKYTVTEGEVELTLKIEYETEKN